MAAAIYWSFGVKFKNPHTRRKALSLSSHTNTILNTVIKRDIDMQSNTTYERIKRSTPRLPYHLAEAKNVKRSKQQAVRQNRKRDEWEGF